MDEMMKNMPKSVEDDEKIFALARVNAAAEQIGLTLTKGQMLALVQAEERALLNAGRVEFGEGVLPKLVYAFCDSPCIADGEYFAVLRELTELFYDLKNDTDGALSDDELVDVMARVFNGRAQGSVAYLRDLSPDDLYQMATGAYRED